MAILYLIALITDWEIFLSDKAHRHGLTGHRSFGGRLKFLTFIDMVKIKNTTLILNLIKFDIFFRIFKWSIFHFLLSIY